MLPIHDEEPIAREVEERLVRRVLTRAREMPVEEVVNNTLREERERLRHADGLPLAASDRAFYEGVRRALPHASESDRARLLRRVVAHYVDEIRGHFDPRVYGVATRILPPTLATMLHGGSPARLLARFPRPPRIEDNVVIEGEVDALRRMTALGSVMLVPTHSSNLDSVILGYVIYRLGLPPFAYGAGLNLFHDRMVGFFLRHLGAYTVDRSKTDPLYRETLEEYTTVLLERGQPNLFFPGGTRSRSGAVERKLKLGLLGAGLSAMRNQDAARPRRVFVVPCTLSYPLVLEASSLVAAFLEAEGRARYIAPADDFSVIERWLAFLRGVAALDLRIHVTLGRPLDPLGNDVDDEGRSHDPRGRVVDPMRYLLRRGVVVADAARDAEYTRTLAARVLTAFTRGVVPLPSHLLAFAVFTLLHHRRTEDDLFRFLRTLGPSDSVGVQEATALVADLLQALAPEGSLRGGSEDGAEAAVSRGLATLGTYHPTKVLERRGDRIFVGDPQLLLFYRNRLDGRGLLGLPSLLDGGHA